MNNEGPNNIVYRPPVECESLLLEVSEGCSYGKCTFCRCSAAGQLFCLCPWEQVERDLLEIRASGTLNKRIFLAGGNVFAFKSDMLLALFDIIKRYLPFVREFSMYARATDILNKDTEQLLELKAQGLSTLYVGVESGSDKFLQDCKKGVSTAQMRKAFEILDTLGIPYGLSCIIGLGGKGTAVEAANATAAFLNWLAPQSLRLMRLTPIEGTQLFKRVEEGTFICQGEKESLMEEYLLLQKLEFKGKECLFVANHLSNLVPMVGYLPKRKLEMLKILEEAIANIEKGVKINPRSNTQW